MANLSGIYPILLIPVPFRIINESILKRLISIMTYVNVGSVAKMNFLVVVPADVFQVYDVGTMAAMKNFVWQTRLDL